MNEISERIKKFIDKNRVLTLATANEDSPYCCSIFYVFLSSECCFYFMSSSESKHIQDASQQPVVAGTIVTGETSIAKIQGIQFTGRFYRPSGEDLKSAMTMYLEKFPLARFHDSELWGVEMDFIKMTDNTLGFGKKIIWKRESEKEIIKI